MNQEASGRGCPMGRDRLVLPREDRSVGKPISDGASASSSEKLVAGVGPGTGGVSPGAAHCITLSLPARIRGVSLVAGGPRSQLERWSMMSDGKTLVESPVTGSPRKRLEWWSMKADGKTLLGDLSRKSASLI